MGIGIGPHANLVLEDEKTVIYEFGRKGDGEIYVI